MCLRMLGWLVVPFRSLLGPLVPVDGENFNLTTIFKNTVVFKPQDCHLLLRQKSFKDLRSLVIGELESRVLLGSVECLQILRNRTVKIVFSDGGTSQVFFDEGFSLNGVNIDLKPPFKPVTRVIVQDVPYHMPAHIIRSVFSTYGEVKGVTFKRATDVLKSRDRILSLDLRHSIPRHIVVGGYYATVFIVDKHLFARFVKRTI